MNKLYSALILSLFVINTYSQTMPTPYAQIPNYPDSYTTHNVAARMIDGLGYRLHWATEGLEEKDVNYKPEGENTKTIGETMDHMYMLAATIKNVCHNLPNKRPADIEPMDFEAQRAAILTLLHEASTFLKETDKPLDTLKIIFQRGEQTSEFPFWNLINGQIADAIYHTGQIVSYRRSSGNPIDPMVNVFIGKNRERK